MDTSCRNLFLFDVDGVIVDPLAYRIGIKETLKLLLQRAGVVNVEELIPTEEDISRMESCGVHDTWDMTNVMFAAVLAELAQRNVVALPESDMSVADSLAVIAHSPQSISKPDYKELASKMRTEPVSHPPDTAFALISQRIEESLPERKANSWIKLLEKFLSSTRSIYDCYGTQLYQNIILGTKEFVETYELQSQYTGECLLATADVVFIEKASVAKLNQLQSDGSARVAIYTGRPSHPPPFISNRVGYSPEAELALRLSGITEFPLVAMGTMQWLAEKHGERTEDLTKPNATQACAAMMACLTGTVDDATLQAAFAVTKTNLAPDDTPLEQLKKHEVQVFVFEDTTSGIQPMLKMADLLNSHGYSVKVVPLGIARDESKKASLAKYCESVFPNVNDAIDRAIEIMSAR